MANKISCLCNTAAILVILTWFISLPVFYGIFAFGDYEKWECYASQDNAITQPWKGLESPPEDYHNVSGNFKMLNVWGFSNFMAPFAIGISFLFFWCFYAMCCGCDKGNNYAGGQSAFLLSLVAVSYFSHFIAMIVMRLRHAGRVCSGDLYEGLSFGTLTSEEPYLHKTGTWLFYNLTSHFYLFMVGLTGTFFMAGLKHY